MSDPKRRTRYDIEIDNPTCPSCLTPTVGVDGNIGRAWKNDQAPVWWKAQCVTCRTQVERRRGDNEMAFDEVIEETAHGKAVRELRELRQMCGMVVYD